MNVKEFKEKMKDPAFRLAGAPVCSKCGDVIDLQVNGVRKYGDKDVCTDCWFDLFGDEIEKHPICMPRVHHG